MNNNNLENLKAAVSSLEETAEGQLRGGFAVIGEDVSPLADINRNCNNDKCNVGCGVSNTGTCSNDSCNVNCVTSPVAKGQAMSLGMTFSL